MLSSAFGLLISCPLLMLRLTGSGSSFPKPLSAKDEQKYIEQMANGDENARAILIEHNLRLVAHIIKKYYTQSSNQDDLISIGTIGLIKGISTYRPDKGVRLTTYASRCIENEILMHFRSLKKTAGELSLSDTIDDSDEGGNLSLMDIISVDDDMFDNLSVKETYSDLRLYIAEELTPREQEIIRLRYGLDGKAPQTQREVADALGISRSYVSRIEKKAVEKLRKRFDDDAEA